MKPNDLKGLKAFKIDLITAQVQPNKHALAPNTPITNDTMPSFGITPLLAKYTQYADQQSDRPAPKPLKHRRDEDASLITGYSIDQPIALPLVLDTQTGQYRASFRCGGVSKAQIKQLRDGLMRSLATLDLHAINRETARTLLLAFIDQRPGTCVRIIHGQGEGILKQCIRAWLAEHPAVLGFTESLPKHGGSGALWVLLRPSETSNQR
jgi:DNA-nicking Smr family endonuclease